MLVVVAISASAYEFFVLLRGEPVAYFVQVDPDAFAQVVVVDDADAVHPISPQALHHLLKFELAAILGGVGVVVPGVPVQPANPKLMLGYVFFAPTG